VLGDDCANPANGLPAPLRASIISLAIWVGRHTSAVIRRREEIEPLIEVNRLIMQGLASAPASASSAAA
jgi:flagellar protein FlaF